MTISRFGPSYDGSWSRRAIGSSKLVMAVKASTAAVEMPIDVVITDIFMDQQEGLATIRVLHREFPEIKVIAITGGIGDFLEDAKAFGAGWAFTKPLALDQFLAAVREAFARPLAPSGHPSPG